MTDPQLANSCTVGQGPIHYREGTLQLCLRDDQGHEDADDVSEEPRPEERHLIREAYSITFVVSSNAGSFVCRSLASSIAIIASRSGLRVQHRQRDD